MPDTEQERDQDESENNGDALSVSQSESEAEPAPIITNATFNPLLPGAPRRPPKKVLLQSL